MNTVKSVYYGWATFIAAGAGAYFFAKRSINADRATKAQADRLKRQKQFEMESAALYPSTSTSGNTPSNGGDDGSANPSVQASLDPAPTRHEPSDERGRTESMNKYVASEPYRSKKGDRFS